jgi:isoquinoline 1-oxidoreductase beta subunit
MELDRRLFIATSIAGAFSLGWKLPRSAQAAETPAAGSGADVGIWAVVHPDDTVIVRIARSEMGQGTLTGLAQLVADEMDADWQKVRAEYVSPEANLASKRAWGDMSTGGSRGIRSSVEYVRKGGAAARAMLIQAAATQWGVPVDQCSASAGVVTHMPGGQTLRYGQLAAAASRLPVPTEVTVKKPSEWKIIGKGVKRLDTVEKLSGKQIFAIDVQLPDMLNATIAQCPVFGGKLVSFDAKAVQGMPGSGNAGCASGRGGG